MLLIKIHDISFLLQNAYPKGEVYIGTSDMGFVLRDGVPPEIKDPGHTFTLRTPSRRYHFAATSETTKEEWMQVIDTVLKTPMLPQEIGNVRR